MLSVIGTTESWLILLGLPSLNVSESSFFDNQPTFVDDDDACFIFGILQDIVNKRMNLGELAVKPDYTVLNLDCENDSDGDSYGAILIAGGFNV